MHPTAVPRTRGGAAATLTVWKFDTYDGADHAEAILERVAQQELITIQDAAIVTWPATRKSPRDTPASQRDRRGCPRRLPHR
jgi:hypothetical protein